MFVICIIVSALAIHVAKQMPDLFRFEAFAAMMNDRRPKPHTFG